MQCAYAQNARMSIIMLDVWLLTPHLRILRIRVESCWTVILILVQSVYGVINVKFIDNLILGGRNACAGQAAQP